MSVIIPAADYKWIKSFIFLSLCSTTAPFSPEALVEREAQMAREQMKQRWESLRLELKTKLQLLQKTLEQDHKQPVLLLLAQILVETKYIHSCDF